MKFTKILILFLTVFAFVGCASTESTQTQMEPEIKSDQTTEEQQSISTNKTLIDRYISGDIAGYRE